MTVFMKKAILLIPILLLLLVSCQSEPIIPYTYQQPENIDDGLDIGTLDEVDIDAELIEKAVNDINRGKYKEMHSMLIFKDDKLALEEYFDGHEYVWDAPNHHGELVTWDRSMLHTIMSDSKSMASQIKTSTAAVAISGRRKINATNTNVMTAEAT